jgi:hypothetical protein
MSEPQFIPSGKPHSVEVAEGSHVAMSKSGNVGPEVRQNVHDHLVQGQEIEVGSDQIVLAASATASDDRFKVPRSDGIERASKGLGGSAQGSPNRSVTGLDTPTPRQRLVYDTEVQEMSFPARLIHLKQENDAVRAQLQDLQSLMGDASPDSQ